MDEPILHAKRNRLVKNWAIGILVAATALALLISIARNGFQFGEWLAQKNLSVNAKSLGFAQVTRGRFEDVITARATLEPAQTLLIDALESGRVEKKLVQNGSRVQAGQLIASLSNSSLALDVIRSEAEVAQQVNQLQSLLLQQSRQRTEANQSLAQQRYELGKLESRRERDLALNMRGFLSTAAIGDLQADLAHARSRLEALSQSSETDNQLMQRLVAQQQSTVQQLRQSLALARTNQDALQVRSARAGLLTGFDVQEGQTISRGQRLGQIDSIDQFKLLANVDEFHLNKLRLNLPAELSEASSASESLEVTRINPQVKAGQFEVELQFKTQPKDPGRRGQGKTIRIFLSEPKQAVLVPVAALDGTGPNPRVWVRQIDGADQRIVREKSTYRSTKLAICRGIEWLRAW